MAFQTGVISGGIPGLLDDLIPFAMAHGGFSSNGIFSFTVSSTAWSGRYLIRDGQYITFAHTTSGPVLLYLNTATSIGNVSLGAQVGANAVSAVTHLGASPIRYWMFADGFSVHCAVEWTGGAFTHLNFGYLEKLGSYVGGCYVGASYWSQSNPEQSGLNSYSVRPFDPMLTTYQPPNGYGHVRCTYAGQTLHSFNSSAAGFPALNLGGNPLSNTDFDRGLIGRGPNTYNGRSALVPVLIAIAETDTSSPASWIPIGEVRNAAHLRIDNLNPLDIILTDWMVFPWCAKPSPGAGVSFTNTFGYGIAYKM